MSTSKKPGQRTPDPGEGLPAYIIGVRAEGAQYVRLLLLFKGGHSMREIVVPRPVPKDDLPKLVGRGMFVDELGAFVIGPAPRGS